MIYIYMIIYVYMYLYMCMYVCHIYIYDIHPMALPYGSIFSSGLKPKTVSDVQFGIPLGGMTKNESGGFRSHGGTPNSWMVYFVENPMELDDFWDGKNRLVCSWDFP